MAGNRKPKKKAQAKRKGSRQSPSGHDQRVLSRHMRQLYIWRVSLEECAQARAEAGKLPAADAEGFNLLAPAPQAKVEAAYNLATHHRQHWQVIHISYCRDARGEPFRLWSWVKTSVPIVARGNGIRPALQEGHDKCLADLGEDELCDGHAVIMAPWDASHPIRPDQLAARLKQRLRLTDHEVQDLKRWGAPETTRLDQEATLDLEIASALRDADSAGQLEV